MVNMTLISKKYHFKIKNKLGGPAHDIFLRFQQLATQHQKHPAETVKII